MALLSDIVLVTRVKMLHDTRAFDALVKKYQQPIRRFFLNLTLGDTALSDDLAQDAFLKAYVNIGQFRAQSNFSTWLFRIAYNVFYDHTRHRRLVLLDCENCEMPTVEPLARDGERMDIYKALGVLSENERLCVTLQLMEGESIDRIATITNMAAGTVKSHLFRGKQKITDYLRKNGYGK